MTSSRIPAAHLDLLNTGRQITIVLSFAGHLDHHAVKNALRALLEVEPVLGCRLDREGKKASWERREDLSSLDLLSMQDVLVPEDAVKRFATDSRIDEPLVNALLIREEAGDTLCIRISHAVTDIPGALALLPAMAELYSRYLAEPDFWPLEGEYSNRGAWQIIDSAGVIETIGTIPAARPPEPVFRGPVGAGDPGEGSGGEGTGTERAGKGSGSPGEDIAMQGIGPERFRVIREAADSRGATMTDVLLAAYFRALCLTLNPPEDRILPLEVSVDMRYVLPDEDFRRIANLSGAEFPVFAWDPDEQFRTTLTRAKEQMDAFDSGYPGLPFILHTSVEAEDDLNQPADAFIPLLEYHNLHDDLVFGDLSVAGGYLVCHGKGPVLCASTFRDTLTLAASFPGNSTEIVDAMVRELYRFP